ncbi:hypothetical protein C8Q80DRAFT_1354381 [Daedaleopsis nitida]|nr:hypothetical protein C8Q80DRAFT_1354381 [Daedaleopsis nitida]
MAADLKEYLSSEHVTVVTGTPDSEFVSAALRAAMEAGYSYMQSPTDDLHSFRRTTLWAAVALAVGGHHRTAELGGR